MLTILTKTNAEEVKNIIASIERLDELVAIVDSFDVIEGATKVLVVEESFIKTTIDWFDTEPPYLFPTVDFSLNNLLALVFYKLGNHQKAFEFVSKQDELYNHLLIATNLQFGYAITKEQVIFLNNTSKHNLAIIYNFGIIDENIDKKTLQNTYEEAIKNGATDAEKLFSVKHYANLLMDNGLQVDAENLIRSVNEKITTKEEENSIDHLLTSSLMAQIKLPYKAEELSEIVDLQQKCIAYYEDKGLKINAGLLLIEASEIANYQEDFIKSKELINKAILYFKEADISEFLGEATLQKATLLYTWSKNGSPQYYKPAINTFQNALKVFKRDTHPQKFADIHHNLALIYSEIQVSEAEKAIWTAFCASSFKEALNFYTKEQFPYEFSMICHNYATALMGFPEAKLHNNWNKAFKLFEDALAIRTEKKYPFERALTLLNQLELYWLLHNEDDASEIKKYNEMLSKASEIHQLVKEEELLEKANRHLKTLENLKTILN